VWIGKETAIIVETKCVLAGEPADHDGFAEHPQHRPIGEGGEKGKGGSEQRHDRQPSRAARREAERHQDEFADRRRLFRCRTVMFSQRGLIAGTDDPDVTVLRQFDDR
jgi:hypothetical protein